MKTTYKFISVISIISLLLGFLFFENIKGYYRFKQYCEREGGLKINEFLEGNVIWEAKNKYEAQVASLLKKISYVKFKDETNGKEYVLRYLGGDPQFDSSFELKEVDENIEAIYLWKSARAEVSGETRLRRFGYEIWDKNNVNIIVRYYGFSYSKFDRDSTLLDMPSYVYCYSDINTNKDISSWREALNTAFKN